jgi:hypothetical protein
MQYVKNAGGRQRATLKSESGEEIAGKPSE